MNDYRNLNISATCNLNMELRLPLPERANHRHVEAVLESEGIKRDWLELKEVLEGISDDEIAEYHTINYPKAMSLSRAYNSLIKEKLTDKGWMDEPRLFSDSNFHDKAWRLDFAKGKIAVEVSFNHGEALAWNMMKLTLAAEMNHVEKEFQSKVGIIILATADLKKAGCFDGACGEWEKAVRYLMPMQSQLSSPILLLGIEAPAFKIIDHGKGENPRTSIEWHSDSNQRSLFEF